VNQAPGLHLYIALPGNEIDILDGRQAYAYSFRVCVTMPEYIKSEQYTILKHKSHFATMKKKAVIFDGRYIQCLKILCFAVVMFCYHCQTLP